jgi:multidrug efflux pump subunit AcrA (membrane-fusion protein)
MNLASLLPVGIASLTALALALPNIKAQSPNTTPQPTLTQPTPAQTLPRRLTIKVSVAEPSDLKVKEGDRIKTGQLIADRSRERTRLNSQKQQLALSLEAG